MGRHNLPNSDKYTKGGGNRSQKRHSPPPPENDRISQNSQSNSTNSSGCFIATAVYGTRHHHNINLLRGFRDSVLIQNDIGRLFVCCYYKTSPPIAHIIAQRPILKRIVRKYIIEPAVKMIVIKY
jgi:hypothetical protein